MSMVNDNHRKGQNGHHGQDVSAETVAFSIVEGIPGRLRPPEQESTGILIDLNEAGLGLVTDVSLQPGDLLQFRMPSIAHKGVVMWTIQEEHKVRAGVRFLQ